MLEKAKKTYLEQGKQSALKLFAIVLSTCDEETVSQAISWLKEQQDREADELLPEEETIIVNNVSFKIIKVQGGTFQMGAAPEQGNEIWANAASPAHRVDLSDYYIGQTLVTQALWEAVMGENPSEFGWDKQCPVENVSWDECQMFLGRLSRLTGKNFRLPTEAEWEFAARGGVKSKGYKYSGSNDINEVAWTDDNSNRRTHPVATKKANELGLYDMSGNLYEWCEDRFAPYTACLQRNPKGSSYGYNRVIRGGCWDCGDTDAQVAYRSYLEPSDSHCIYGLRLAI